MEILYIVSHDRVRWARCFFSNPICVVPALICHDAGEVNSRKLLNYLNIYTRLPAFLTSLTAWFLLVTSTYLSPLGCVCDNKGGVSQVIVYCCLVGINFFFYLFVVAFVLQSFCDIFIFTFNDTRFFKKYCCIYLQSAIILKPPTI